MLNTYCFFLLFLARSLTHSLSHSLIPTHTYTYSNVLSLSLFLYDLANITNTPYIDEVKSAGGKLLIHAAFGNSRPASVVLALLMIRNKWSLNRSWEWLQVVVFTLSLCCVLV
jgi:uncharacterized membrane protein YadS